MRTLLCFDSSFSQFGSYLDNAIASARVPTQTMDSFRKTSLRIRFVITLVALLAFSSPLASGFAPSVVTSPKQSLSSGTAHTATSTVLASSPDNNAEKKSHRREFFSWFRRAALVGAGNSLLPTDVAAEDSIPGRIVEIQVSNLEGNPDQTGVIKIQLEPSWAPRGVQRFEDLTAINFWKDCRIFRVLPGFVAQFGISGNPSLQAEWRAKSFPDDPVRVSNSRGTVVFATAGPNSRTTQLVINKGDNTFLDKQGFSPIGKVIEGMDYVDQFYRGYGEGAPSGQGPNQGLIQLKGNSYLRDSFSKLSFISGSKFSE
jgi:peptidyl-prolyl cis-trans isomerase A (cyclophilin A)